MTKLVKTPTIKEITQTIADIIIKIHSSNKNNITWTYQFVNSDYTDAQHITFTKTTTYLDSSTHKLQFKNCVVVENSNHNGLIHIDIELDSLEFHGQRPDPNCWNKTLTFHYNPERHDVYVIKTLEVTPPYPKSTSIIVNDKRLTLELTEQSQQLYRFKENVYQEAQFTVNTINDFYDVVKQLLS